ncbi:unnamed protein product, partial [Ixodes hexagonus]
VFSDECRKRHNFYRTRHGVSPLENDEKLRLLAKDWADKLANLPAGTPLRHRPNNKYGENIYMAWSSDPNFRVDAKTPVDDWYNEIRSYDYAKPGFKSGTGHFTQVVWKSSTHVGCAVSRSSFRNAYFVVCNYDPAGNYLGEFVKNVLRPKPY